MKHMEEVLQVSNLEAVYSESEIFLNAKDGLEFIKLCEREGWAVIGIEGGSYDGKVFTPDLSLAEDYSSLNFWNWHQFRKTCNSKASELLKTFVSQDKLRFYLVFANEQDFNKIVRQEK